MFSFFKRQVKPSIIKRPLLEDCELLRLRQLAEQIDCSASSQMLLESRQSGSLASSSLGSGVDYAESRVYQPGDDIRSINWRLSARSHETFVKTFHLESRPSINIFLDRRRSMVFGTRQQLKITQAVRVACLLAYAADYHQLDFQAWIVDEENEENNEESIKHYDNTAFFLLEANKPCSIETSDLNRGISLVLKKMSELSSECLQANGSFVYLLSDFSDLEKKHQAGLARLQEQYFVQAIHFFDRAEFELPKIGKLRLQAMHEDNICQLDTFKQEDRENFARISKHYFEIRKSLIKDLGIVYQQLETDVDDLQEYVLLPLGRA